MNLLVVTLTLVSTIALAALTIDRYGATKTRGRVPVYMLRASNGHALYAGVTAQNGVDAGKNIPFEVSARWEQHADKATWNARAQTWKELVDYERSTVARWCWTPAQAFRVERRMILAMSAMCRLGRLVGLSPRWLGNVQHHRAPRYAVESVLVWLWLAGYVLAGWVWPAGRLVLPWAPGG